MTFVLIFFSILALLHVYLWRRLVHDTRLPTAARHSATLLLGLLCISIPLTMMLFRRSGEPAAIASYIWLGVMFYLFTALVIFDLLRLPVVAGSRLKRALHEHRLSDSGASPPPATADKSTLETRRVFIARSAATSALIASSGVSLWGMRSALWELATPEVPVTLARLPKALDGYTIAVLSDIHIGATLDARFLRHLVDKTNAMRVDLAVIVGDLVDGAVADIGPQVAELRRLRARNGVYFVTGNHEYYSGVEPWIAYLRKLGIVVLMNQRVELGDLGVGGARFDLAGVPDHHAASFAGVAPNALTAVVGRDPDRELIMLAHQPVQIDDVIKSSAGLQLSGHTHGGQLFPFGALTQLVQPYIAGLHHHKGSSTQIYVSRGSGFWGPPMRVLAPAEITHIHLVSGA